MKDLREIYETRRSVNYFDKNKEIEEDTLKDIINMAVLAPSAFNIQPWEIVVIKSDKARKELYEKACNQQKVLDAPVTLAIIGDTNGYKRDNIMWDEKINNGLSEDKAKGIINHCDTKLYPTSEKKVAFAARNSSLLAMSIMYSAKYHGVESHPMIGFDEDKVKELFDIDDDKIVTMLITMGYHDNSNEIKPRERRLMYHEIVKEV